MARVDPVGSADHGGGTILVLEDDPGVARLERLRLERAGYTVAAADSGPEARRLIERGGIDLLLLDYQLAGNVSGLEFYRELKSAGLAVPSVLVTGFSDDAMLAEAIRTGIRDFLPKTPDYLDFLVPTVRRVLAQVRTERELEEQRETLIREQAARAEAQSGEEKLRLIIENVRGHAIFTLDLEGNIASWNAGAEQVFGYPASEILGRSGEILFTPEDRRALQPELEMEICRRDGRASDDRWHLRKDGSRFFASGNMEALRDHAEGLRGFVKVVRDQTERKRLEDERRQYTEQLKEADRRKDEFLAMLAHELRNPLAAIANAAQLTRLSSASEHREWANGILDKQVRHLARLIDDLLDVSRITRGKIELRKQRLDLGLVIQNAIHTTRPLIAERRHELIVQVPSAPLHLDADPTRIEQVLVNLLSNAAKYTEAGGRIELDARRDGAQIVVRIQDTGVGMTPELLARAFDLFAQGDRSIARSEGGLGIGLTLAKSLIEMHGGTILAESEGPGRGSKITIQLHAANGPDTATIRAQPLLPEQGKTGHLRVIVVDDNADMAHGMAQLLKLLGHHVEVAHDGPACLRMAEATPPDVILLDIGLPEMDGFEVARRLRDGKLKDLTIVAVSGYGEQQAVRRSRESGFNHHLVKPIEINELSRILAEVTQQPESQNLQA